MDLGEAKLKEKKENCQRVFSTIIALQNSTTKEIEKRLDAVTKWINEGIENEAQARLENPYYGWTKKDKIKFIKQNWKRTISERTIQRCIEGDNRIVKNGRYYTVDEDSRFENRYLDPKGFGDVLYNDVIPYAGSFTCNRASMSDLITRFGAIIMYIFIEASKPFEDKRMSIADREDLVKYWAKNAIPFSQMFYTFTEIFNSKYAKVSKNKPYNEMEKSQTDECIKFLESICPDIFKDLAKHSRKDAKN